jgi:hypothetical protein
MSNTEKIVELLQDEIESRETELVKIREALDSLNGTDPQQQVQQRRKSYKRRTLGPLGGILTHTAEDRLTCAKALRTHSWTLEQIAHEVKGSLNRVTVATRGMEAEGFVRRVDKEGRTRKGSVAYRFTMTQKGQRVLEKLGVNLYSEKVSEAPLKIVTRKRYGKRYPTPVWKMVLDVLKPGETLSASVIDQRIRWRVSDLGKSTVSVAVTALVKQGKLTRTLRTPAHLGYLYELSVNKLLGVSE